MKKTIMTMGLLFLFLGALAGSSFAQMKIAVVNSNDVLEKSAEGKRTLARIQEADKQNQAKIAKIDDDIRQLQTKLNTQRITMTDEAIMMSQSELERKQTQRKRDAEDAYAQMQELTNRLFKKLQDELIPIVELIGKERGLDIIFDRDKSGAVYFSPAIELTVEVIKRYDQSKATQK
jgi:Skp family chaperone for outer membrane proteins